MLRSAATLAGVVGICAGLICTDGSLFAQQSAPAAAPPGPGLELIQRSCVSCHDIYTITEKRKTPDDWAITVGMMADRGAPVTPDEMQIIGDYLAHNFAASANSSSAAESKKPAP